jgi:hypothetical protein
MEINLGMSLEIAWRTFICSIIVTYDPHCVTMGQFAAGSGKGMERSQAYQ